MFLTRKMKAGTNENDVFSHSQWNGKTYKV